MRLSTNDYICGKDASTTASGCDPHGLLYGLRLRGRRTTGAPTYLLHLTLQPGFESDPPELQAGTGKRQIEKACDCKPS